MQDVQRELLKRIREKREEAPWAYDDFIHHLQAPTELNNSFDALVVLSYEERNADGQYFGMKPENAARVEEISRRWLALPWQEGAKPSLVMVSSSEATPEMLMIALDAGVPSGWICMLSELPLSQCNSGQQMRDLARLTAEKGWGKIYILSSFYHMLRCLHTANMWFTGNMANREFGYIMWPPEEQLEDPAKMDALMEVLALEIKKTLQHCPPAGI